MEGNVDKKVLDAFKKFAAACSKAGYMHVSGCYIREEDRGTDYMSLFQTGEDINFGVTLRRKIGGGEKWR